MVLLCVKTNLLKYLVGRFTYLCALKFDARVLDIIHYSTTSRECYSVNLFCHQENRMQTQEVGRKKGRKREIN